jgi:hypothetical protein
VVEGANAKKNVIGPFGLETKDSFYDEVADFITDSWSACWAPSSAMFYDKVVGFITIY